MEETRSPSCHQSSLTGGKETTEMTTTREEENNKTDSADTDGSHLAGLSNKRRRQQERGESEAELRKVLDPEGKMTKKEWRQAKGEYYMSRLPAEVLQSKLHGKFASFASNILKKAGIQPTVDVEAVEGASKKRARSQQDRARDENKEDGGAEEEGATGGFVDYSSLDVTEYYFSKGDGSLRYVWPYHYVFHAHVKARWSGRTLEDVIFDEFAAFDEIYFRNGLRHGRFRVNGVPVSADYVFSIGDKFEHHVHRHEPPVRAHGVVVVHSDPAEGLYIVNKPCTIPVHPCGKFRFNSLVYILAKEHGLRSMHMVHRIDRPTSGLMLFATSPEAAEKFSRKLRERTVQKHYLARVRGRFPATVEEAWAVRGNGRRFLCCMPSVSSNSVVTVDTATGARAGTSAEVAADIVKLSVPDLQQVGDSVELWQGVRAVRFAVPADDAMVGNSSSSSSTSSSSSSSSSTSTSNNSGNTTVWGGNVEMVVDAPIAVSSAKFGVFAVGGAGDDGKESQSAFRAVTYDPVTDTSLVHCIPKTGRTHQLRVHLAHLGFPIANDERYGGTVHVMWDSFKARALAGVPLDQAGSSTEAGDAMAAYAGANHTTTTTTTSSSSSTPSSSASSNSTSTSRGSDNSTSAPSNSSAKTYTTAEVERREWLWKQSFDPRCLSCADVNYGIWKDRFHFVPKGSTTTTTSSSASANEDDVDVDGGNQTGRRRLLNQPTSDAAANALAAAAVEASSASVSTSCTSSSSSDGDAAAAVRTLTLPRLADGSLDMDAYPAVTDIDPEREAIWLHAYKYEGPGFAFQVLLPDFADGLTTFEIPSFLPTSKTQQGTDASASS